MMDTAKPGFTLIELTVVLGIIVLLFATILVLVNPAAQLAKARNARRQSDLNLIAGAVGENIADNKGSFSCSSGAIPTSTARMATTTGAYNIAPCLVPVYLSNLPFDPATSGARWASAGDYDTGYYISQSSTTGRITVSAPAAELGESMSLTR